MIRIATPGVIGLLLLALLAGCTTAPRGNGAHVTYYGSFDTTDDFEMDGHISSGGGVPEKDVFRSVSIRLYANDGALICTREVGDLTANHGQRNVSISTGSVPHYVLILSPDFWDGQTEVDYLEYDGDEEMYVAEGITSRESLPVAAEETQDKRC